jgi:hypothetical protein
MREIDFLTIPIQFLKMEQDLKKFLSMFHLILLCQKILVVQKMNDITRKEQ